MIQNDVHLRKTLGETGNLGVAGGAGLDAHGQAVFFAKLPGGEGGRIIQRAGVEFLGAAACENAEARNATGDPVLHDLGRIGGEHVDRAYTRHTLRVELCGIGEIRAVKAIAGGRMDNGSLGHASRIHRRDHVFNRGGALFRPFRLNAEQRDAWIGFVIRRDDVRMDIDDRGHVLLALPVAWPVAP